MAGARDYFYCHMFYVPAISRKRSHGGAERIRVVPCLKTRAPGPDALAREPRVVRIGRTTGDLSAMEEEMMELAGVLAAAAGVEAAHFPPLQPFPRAQLSIKSLK